MTRSEVNGSSAIDLPPRASALIEAMRDIGYSFEAAVADIVDNSIAAKARTVDIRYGWSSEAPWIAVVDDGMGMTREVLLEAMRPGSRSPLLERARDDLGRFGLGLKTASFSQCRELTVVTRRDGHTWAMRWDLDLVGRTDEWRLLEIDATETDSLPAMGQLGDAGTLVLWRQIDRLELAGSGASGHAAMNELMGVVREHLARVYHRFLAGEPGRQRLVIRINAAEVEAFDPFAERHRATQILPQETVPVHGGEVVIQPFILPHHSRVSAREYERLAGPEGYLRNQGFYVYRNRRLIIWGTWFRLARQEELTKLARVRIDVPNTVDHLWGIDVRKSRAQPPAAVRHRLRQIVDQIRGSARRPYTHRGMLVAQSRASPVWMRRVFNDRIEYALNEDHPIISEILTDLDTPLRNRLRAVLGMVGRAFPAAAFFSDYASEPARLDRGEADLPVLAGLARMVLAANPGARPDDLRQMLRDMEPFASWPRALDDVVQVAFNAHGDVPK